MSDGTEGAENPTLLGGEPAAESNQPAANETDKTNEAGATPEKKEPAAENQPIDYSLDAADFDGLGMDAGFIDGYADLAKKFGLDQENATSLLKDAWALANKMDVENVTKQVEEWRSQSSNDKEFGGAAINANLAIAKKAIDTYGTPEIKNLLESTGLGNNPEVIRFFFRVGKTLQEDGYVAGKSNIAESDPAKVLFPTML